MKCDVDPLDHANSFQEPPIERYDWVIRGGYADNAHGPADAIEVESGSIHVDVAIVMNHPILTLLVLTIGLRAGEEVSSLIIDA